MNRRNSGGWAGLCALALLAGCSTSQAENTTTEVEVQPPQVQEEQAAEMPVDEPEKQEGAAAALRELLEEQLSAGKQMAGGTWSACVLPLDDAEPVIMNARPLRSASLIKLFVAGAVCEQWDAVDARAQYAGDSDVYGAGQRSGDGAAVWQPRAGGHVHHQQGGSDLARRSVLHRLE